MVPFLYFILMRITDRYKIDHVYHMHLYIFYIFYVFSLLMLASPIFFLYLEDISLLVHSNRLHIYKI